MAAFRLPQVGSEYSFSFATSSCDTAANTAGDGGKGLSLVFSFTYWVFSADFCGMEVFGTEDLKALEFGDMGPAEFLQHFQIFFPLQIGFLTLKDHLQAEAAPDGLASLEGKGAQTIAAFFQDPAVLCHVFQPGLDAFNIKTVAGADTVDCLLFLHVRNLLPRR